PVPGCESFALRAHQPAGRRRHADSDARHRRGRHGARGTGGKVEVITPYGLILSSARRMTWLENGRRVSRAAMIASGIAVLVFLMVVLFFRDRSMVEVAEVILPPRPPAILMNEPEPPAPELPKNVSEV